MSKTDELKDQQSRERIVRELDCNMLVEAGAGSGKTHMMAARMAAGIASGAYTVEHMAAVTFTVKAAAELRGRFQLALESELALVPQSISDSASLRADRVRAALSNLERFFAGTIHSFCAHLLRERPIEAGLSPGFTELDDVENLMRQRQSWRDYRAGAKTAGDLDMLALLEVGLEPKYLDDAFARVCMHAEVDFPPGDAPCPDPLPAWAALEDFWKRLNAKLRVPVDADTTCPTQKAMRLFERRYRVADRTQARTLAELLDIWDFTPHIVQIRWSDDQATKKRLNQEIPALHSDFLTTVVQPFLLAWRQYLYRLSVTVLMKARGRAEEDRRRDNVLNYGDLLQLMARVLNARPEVLHALQDKYRWIFVDEFQDTDPIQADIIFALSGGRPGSLFVVGDPKQSIYRFTRADIDVYNSARKRFEEHGAVVPLTTNFRSVPALCGWANDVFKSKFPDEATVYSPKFAPLDAERKKGGAGTGLFTLTVPDTVDKSDLVDEEAGCIARVIRADVDAGRRGFGDFLILTRKKKQLDRYASALEALRIPVEVSGAGAFGDSAEVRSLALLLRALADPQDSVSLLGVLRGPLFGISDPELFAHRQAGGAFSIFDGSYVVAGLQPGGSDTNVDSSPSRVGAALSSLREMFHHTRVLPAGAALERILERTGYLALAATSPGGVEAGDLLHAIDRVRAVVESGFSLLDAAEALGDDADESSEVESLPLEPGRRDVVRIMNLHKAKGLEAAVVFLADPCGGFKPHVDVRIVREGAAARGYLLITRKVGEFHNEPVAEPVGWAAHEAEEQHYLEAEAERLLYVAATRARDALMVGRWEKPGSGPTRAWGEFDAHLGTAAELAVPATVAAPVLEKVPLSRAAALKARTAREAAHAKVLSPSWSAASVTGESHHIARMSVARPEIEACEDASDPTRVISADTPSRRADAGVAWGTLIHGLLEHAMRHKQATRDDLRRLAMWLTMEEDVQQLRAVIDEALDTVQVVAAADFWTEARVSPECHEEVPFAILETNDGAAVPKVANGTIDSVFRETAGWKIVDYKTDVDATAAILQQRYGDQLAAYVNAWRRFTDGDVTSALVDARKASVKVEGS
jgi:ATP-dependent helicase/nuclease subunit A